MLPLLFIRSSQNRPRRVQKYPAAITGGTCCSLTPVTTKLGALLESHIQYPPASSISAIRMFSGKLLYTYSLRHSFYYCFIINQRITMSLCCQLCGIRICTALVHPALVHRFRINRGCFIIDSKFGHPSKPLFLHCLYPGTGHPGPLCIPQFCPSSFAGRSAHLAVPAVKAEPQNL